MGKFEIARVLLGFGLIPFGVITCPKNSASFLKNSVLSSWILKELYAIVWATKYFRPYLFGKKFNIVTDHKPLQWLFSLKDPNSKLIRWRLKLEEFDYTVYYKKGKLNSNADCLSRIECHNKDIFKYMDQFNQNFGQSTSHDLDNLSTVVNLDQNDIPSTSQMTQVADNDNDLATVHTNQEENPIVQIPISDTPVNIGNNQLILSYVYHSPHAVKIERYGSRQRIIAQLSQNSFQDNVIKLVKEYLVPNVKYSLYFEDPTTYEPFCEIVRTHFRYPSYKLQRHMTKLVDVIDPDEIKDIINNYHTGKTNHRGIQETLDRINKKYYWTNMKKSIQEFINECETCQKTKYDRNPIKLEFNITPTPSKPFEILHVDTFFISNQRFLTIIDKFSKYAQAYCLNNVSGLEITKNLINFFSHHGVPKLIVSDNGSEFKNTIVEDCMRLHKIETHFTSPNHSQSNSPVERLHSTLIEHLRILNEQYPNEPIQDKMIYAILGYNNSIHSVTKFKPIDIVNGHTDSTDFVDIDLAAHLRSDYVMKHREQTALIYSHLNAKMMQQKENLINKLNQTRDKDVIVEPEQIVFVKSNQRSKIKNKFRKEKVQTVQKNTINENSQKIHKDNIKRPHKIKIIQNVVSGPSSQ